MEARIFMKFETYVHKIVLDHQPNFHKDLCKDARARGVNTRTRDEMYLEVFEKLVVVVQTSFRVQLRLELTI